MSNSTMATTTNPVEICNLTFSYTSLEGSPVTKNLTLSLPKGTRCLLVGSNGAGKTTLLNVLGGKHMVSETAVQILGQAAFSNTHPGITVLSGQWSKSMAGGGGVPYQNDVSVNEMLDTLRNDGKQQVDTNRLANLLHILDINPTWRMHMVSDGQRRRVQILMALVKPFEVLLLDEVTVDLDVVARADLLDFLKMETETRGATILYATHIFDGLDEWCSHLAYMTCGEVARYGAMEEFEDLQTLMQGDSACPLLDVVEAWLREERVVLKAQREEKALKDNNKETDLKLSKKPKNSNDPFARNRMYNYW